MEYGGVALTTYMLDIKENFDTKVKIMCQVAGTFHELRNEKLFYGDMKLDNITIKDGDVRIIDFGISLVAPGTTVFLRGATDCLGFSPTYAPPEILTWKKYNYEPVDVYCFGKMFFQFFYNLSAKEMEDALKTYATTISGGDKPGEKLVYKCDREAYQNNFLGVFKNQVIKGDPTEGIYSMMMNELLVKCMNYDPVRPTFSKIIEDLKKFCGPLPEKIQIKPDLTSSGYCKLTEIYYFNPTTRTLFKAKKAIAEYESYDSKFSGETTHLKINIPEEYENLSSITTPQNRVFIIGGAKNKSDLLDEIYEIQVENGNIVPIPKVLTKGRIYPALVADPKYIYVIGGEDINNIHCNSCEAIDYNSLKSFPMPSLNEPKSKIAACIFNNNLIFAFGGNLDTNFDRKPRLLHDSSDTVERLDISKQAKWEIIAIKKTQENEWGGTEMSVAIPYKESIIIFGGYIRNSKDEYKWETNMITYSPKDSTFGKIVVVADTVLDHCLNSGYCIQDNTVIVFSGFPKGQNCQTFYSAKLSPSKWSINSLNH